MRICVSNTIGTLRQVDVKETAHGDIRIEINDEDGEGDMICVRASDLLAAMAEVLEEIK